MVTELVQLKSVHLTERFSDAVSTGSSDATSDSDCLVSQLSVTAAGLRTKIWMISFKPTL